MNSLGVILEQELTCMAAITQAYLIGRSSRLKQATNTGFGSVCLP